MLKLKLEFLKNTFFCRTPQVAASVAKTDKKKQKYILEKILYEYFC